MSIKKYNAFALKKKKKLESPVWRAGTDMLVLYKALLFWALGPGNPLVGEAV